MSLPSSRADAARLNASKYFTGKLCANGHMAPRYTQSGTCQDCITCRKDREPLAWQTDDAKREQLQPVRVRVSAENYRRVLELAYNLTRIRFPQVLPKEVERRPGGRDSQGGLLLYTLHVHQDDAVVLHSYAASLIPRSVDVGAVRARIFNTLAAKADAGYCEPERIQ